jgi:hypothetical protein
VQSSRERSERVATLTFAAVEYEPADHRVASVLRAQPVDRLFAGADTADAGLDQVGLGARRFDQVLDADADQPEPRPVGFALQQAAAGLEDRIGEGGGVCERSRPRA